MLSQRAASSLPSMVMHHARRHLPASSTILSKIVSIHHCNRGGMSSSIQSSPRFLCTAAQHNVISNHPLSIPPHYSALNQHRWLSSHPICENIDGNIAKDLSSEEFDNAYKYIYHQHNHPRGPWLRTLKTAEHVLSGIHSPRILVVGSGPGEPSATLASNFLDAEVISAHSTTKCVEWASQRFDKHGLSNVTARLVPSMENLDVFHNGSFDLVVSCYGLAHTTHPQDALNEIHRILKPGGTFIASVWENLPADPASDIILRQACVGPRPFHKEDGRDVVDGYACPLRSKRPMSLSKPHLLESMLDEARLSVVEVANDEYPLHLGKTKEFAFKALTLPIKSELQVLNDTVHYHCQDAAEAFEDVLKEGFMVKQHENGDMEVPYNVYKYVVARRQYEDGDMKTAAALRPSKSGKSAVKAMPIKPADICVKDDPIIFDTWNRLKEAASEKIVNAVKKQVDGFKHDSPVMILDAAPSAYSSTVTDLATSHPYAKVVATSKSVNVVATIRDNAVKHGLSNVKVKALDASHMTTLGDKTFDVIICSFGLAFMSSPTDTLKEFRRLLKPGGSLVISTWEDFSLNQLSDFIVDKLNANGNMEDFIDINSSSADVLRQLTPFAKPRVIESLLDENGFNVMHSEHETAKILLSDSSCKVTDYGVNVATFAIRPFLKELEKGANKNAFNDAKKAFESLLKDPSLVSKDKCGNLVTTLPSRFKIVTAERGFDDSDGFLTNTNKDATPKTDAGRTVFKVKDIPK